MLRITLLAALALSATTGLAAAQSTTPSTPPANTAPGTQSGGGMQGVQTGVVPLRYVVAKPADTLSSRLVGSNVYNRQDEKIGDIEDLVIENGKTVTALVIGVGGFLGIGGRYVAVDPSTVTLVRQDGGSTRVVMDTTKDNLRNAPAFEYNRR